MAKKNSKKNPARTFSEAFTKAVAQAAWELLGEGKWLFTTREEIANRLVRQNAVTETNLQILTMMVGEAVKLGEVPEYAGKRGPGCGIYHVPTLQAHEEAVAAEAS